MAEKEPVVANHQKGQLKDEGEAADVSEPRMLDPDRGYKHTVVGGLIVPGFIKPKLWREMMAQTSLRSSDIVIATYPKAGTTWMQQIVLTLLAGGDGSKVRDPMGQSPWPEASISKGQRNVGEWEAWYPPEHEQVVAPTRRVIKTHSPSWLVPWKGGVENGIVDGCRVIVVTRNSKDVAVSLFHHTKDVPEFAFTGDFDFFLRKMYLLGDVEFGCYWEWHAGWFRQYQQQKDRILWISYEDLMQDSASTIRKVAEFCKIPFDDKVIEGVRTASSFDTMKKTFAEVDQEKIQKGLPVKKNHIRQGLSGAWSKVMNKEQEEETDRVHCQKCSQHGLPDNFLSLEQ